MIHPQAATKERSDAALVDLLNQHGSMGIGEIGAAMHVTSTAVRQRLSRLMADGLVKREASQAARGRPSHRYSLTAHGRREAGSNFTDLALALWNEVRAIRDPDVRAGLLQRIAKTMAGMYSPRVTGNTTAERMQSVADLLGERNVPLRVETDSHQLPILTAVACPYPELAEHDRGICAVENLLFSELVGERVKLTDCRLDGAGCCRFETN